MHKDPIVEEIHAIRRELAKECNNDLKTIVQRAMLRQQQHKNQNPAANPTVAPALPPR